MCSCGDKPSMSTLQPRAYVPPRVRDGVQVPSLRDHQAKLTYQLVQNVQVSSSSCCPHPTDRHRLSDAGSYCQDCTCRREW